MNARQWLDAYADELDISRPTTSEFKAVLDLAGEAAHASERVAAPVACWLAARAGLDLPRAIALAKRVGGTQP